MTHDAPPRETVVFVDDEPAIHEALARNLRRRKADWRPVFFQDPQAALEAMRDAPPDAAVLDLRMPEMDGLTLAERMRAHGLDAAIIVLSGCNDFRSAQEAINRAKAFRYYVKPCPTDELAVGVEEALAQRRRARDEAARTAPDAPPIGTQALDRLAYGVVVADADGRVLYANQMGGEALAHGDGLALDPSGVCRALYRRDSDRLSAARRKAAESGESVALSIERAESDIPLRLVVMPLDETGRTLIFITDPARRSELSPALIGQMFGLTPSEARLTAELCGGADLGDAAEACGIRKATARSYLKQIFLKVGVSRQAELVQMVLAPLAAR